MTKTRTLTGYAYRENSAKDDVAVLESELLEILDSTRKVDGNEETHET